MLPLQFQLKTYLAARHLHCMYGTFMTIELIKGQFINLNRSLYGLKDHDISVHLVGEYPSCQEFIEHFHLSSMQQIYDMGENVLWTDFGRGIVSLLCQVDNNMHRFTKKQNALLLHPAGGNAIQDMSLYQFNQPVDYLYYCIREFHPEYKELVLEDYLARD